MVQLKNGSTLLVEVLAPDGEAVVLAKTETAFATWRKDGDGNTFWGNYFRDTIDGLKQAVADLETRASH